MESSAKRERETILPNQLWPKRGNINAKESEFNGRDDDVNEDTGGEATPPKKPFEKNHLYRMGIPIKPSEKSASHSLSKKSSLDKYHKSYNIDQAGTGVIALKDTENLPICLIKCRDAGKMRSIRGLQFASHRNILSLIDHFQSGDKLHLVYEYEHMAISLGCVAGNVQFSDADIATVCKEILEGLKFIHSALKSSYGLLDFSNVLLTWQGEVKLGMSCPLNLNFTNSREANIGECLLKKNTSDTIQKDIQDVGSIVVFLSDRTAALLESSHELNTSPLSQLAHLFVQRSKEDTTAEEMIRVSISSVLSSP
jgi:serine/threonine protein kinase